MPGRPAPTPPRRSARGLAKDALGDQGRRRAARPRRRARRRRRIEIVTAKSKQEADDALWLIRHDAAHVMATAVVELWPGTKVSIGPPIENGFYYDFEFPEGERSTRPTSSGSRRRCASTSPPTRRSSAPTSPAAEAIERFRGEDQPYKVELIEDLVRDEGVETVSLYRNGPFTDLCRGPHAPSTGRIKAIKLNSIAGAYWRGDETRQMLTRIYGTAFHSKEDLDRAPRADRAGARERPPPPRARSSASSASARRRRGCRSGCRRGPCCCG